MANLIDIIKNDSNKDLLTVILLKYNIFSEVDDEEFLKRYEKIQNFLKKYNDLEFKEINIKFKEEFKEELEFSKISELNILREIIQKIYLKNKNIIDEEIEEINDYGKKVLKKIISNIDIQKENNLEINKNINVNKKISNEKNKRKEHKPKVSRSERKEENKQKLEILLDNINLSDEFEIRDFLLNIEDDYKKIYNEFLENKISENIKIKIEKMGLDRFLKNEEINKDKILIQIIKYFENNDFIKYLEKVLKDDRFCFVYINKLKGYIDDLTIKESLGIENYKLDFSEETFDIEELKKILNFKVEKENIIYESISNYFLEENQEKEEIFFDIINYFSNKEEIEKICNNYYSFEETKNRNERTRKN